MRFTKANAAFSCLRKIWSNKTYLPQELKIRVFNTFRYNSKSLVVQVLRRQSLQNRTKGDVFSDMPNVHFDALKDKLNDDKEWEKIIKFIKSDSAGDP